MIYRETGTSQTGRYSVLSFRAALLLPGALLLLGCSEPAPESDAGAPDLILTNARIVTMDASDTVAEAIAITGTTITAIGSAVEVTALAGSNTETIDLDGNSVTPGIIDTHNHFAWGATTALTQLDLVYPAVTSIEGVRQKLLTAVADAEPGTWIQGWGWDAAKLEEQRDITAEDLDDLSADNPVWLVHTSSHYGVANSQALALADIDADTPNPEGGVIVRDADGRPTGVLTDQAMDLVRSLIPDETVDDFIDGITNLVGDLSREGITAIKDPEIYPYHWDAYKAVEANGDLTVRVYTLWRVGDTVAEARQLRDRIAPFTHPREQDGSGLVVSAGVKIYIDGSGTARTAWVWEDWNEDFTGTDEGNKGLTYIEPNVLFDQIRLFHDAGIHVGTHAIGDRAIDFTMDAYDRALADNPTSGLRHSIIHSNLPTDHALDLMVRLQGEYDTGYPEVQPAFLWWIGDVYAGNFGPERSQRVLPLRTFESRGIRWAGASDFDVSPYAPRHAFWAASVREPLLGTHGNNPWGTDESVGIHETLRAYTATAARQVFLEDRVGTLEVGKLADIVAWDRDLYATPVDALREVTAILTLMNGEVVFRATAEE
jgi:predicted amidohydrolase YtcJ